MKTPKSQVKFISLLVVFYVVQFVGHILHNNAIDNSLGVQSFTYFSFDNPLFVQALKSQCFLFPVIFIFLLPAVLNYQGNKSLLTWNSDRLIWALSWSIIYIAVALFVLFDALRIYNSTNLSIGNLVNGLAFAILFSMARAEVVVKPNNRIK